MCIKLIMMINVRKEDMSDRGTARYIIIFFHQAVSNANNYSSGKLNYKQLIKYYKLLQSWQKPFAVEIYVVM